jgi:hypothetical protein
MLRAAKFPPAPWDLFNGHLHRWDPAPRARRAAPAAPSDSDGDLAWLSLCAVDAPADVDGEICHLALIPTVADKAVQSTARRLM